MDVPESDELRRHRAVESKRDNELMIWLFAPAYMAAICVLVAAIARWDPAQVVPYFIYLLLACATIGTWRRRGITGLIAVLVLYILCGVLLVLLNKAMFNLLSMA